MAIDVAQSAYHVLTSATAIVRARYDAERTSILAEGTVDGHTIPELLPELVAATAYPNPPGAGASWVGFSIPAQTNLPGLALAYGRTVYRLRVRCGVRSTGYRTGAGDTPDDMDRTGQDAGWKSAALFSQVVATILVRHLTDYAGIYSAATVAMTPQPGNSRGGNDTFVTDVDLEVAVATYNAALTV